MSFQIDELLKKREYDIYNNDNDVGVKSTPASSFSSLTTE